MLRLAGFVNVQVKGDYTDEDFGPQHTGTQDLAGGRCMAATSAPFALTAPAASPRRAGCASTSGATAPTTIW